MSFELKSLIFLSYMIVLLLPVTVFAQNDDGWNEETIIDVSIVGNPVINLDSSNTLLRVYVDITNFDPSDGYYFMRVIQSTTDAVISEENIIIREKSNGKAGADVAHLVTEDEIEHTGTLQGDYEIQVFTEFGSTVGNATFAIIKPSESITPIYSEISESEDISTENNESNEIEENNSELINNKKIPDWVKNIFVMYSYDEISENELLNALKYLIDQGIIEITQ